VPAQSIGIAPFREQSLVWPEGHEGNHAAYGQQPADGSIKEDVYTNNFFKFTIQFQRKFLCPMTPLVFKSEASNQGVRISLGMLTISRAEVCVGRMRTRMKIR